MEEAQAFIRSLLRGAGTDAYLTLTAIHPDRRHRVPSRHSPAQNTELQRQALQALFSANRLGWGAYVGLAWRQAGLGRYQRGGKANLLALPVLFVDLDYVQQYQIERLLAMPSPSWTIASGGAGHLHCYWLLEEASQDFKRLQALLQSLAIWLDGDPSMSLDQSMRLPGSYNLKDPQQPRLCQPLGSTNMRYRLDDFLPYERQQKLWIPARRDKLKTSRQSGQVLNPRLIDAVTERLLRDYQAKVKSNGWYRSRCLLPHRDQSEAHGSWKPEIGFFHCFGKHGSLLMRDICQILALSIPAYGGLYLQKPAKDIHHVPKSNRDFSENQPGRGNRKL